MNKYLIAVVGFLASIMSQTIFAVTPATATVKIYSGLCNGDKDKFRGSAVLFTHQAEVYVLTSEHVVLHGNESHGQPICHRVWNEVAGSNDVTLIKADWGTGLALLKAKLDGQNLDLPSLANLQAKGVALKAGTSAVTFGFPYASDVQFSGDDGVLLNVKSDRAFIPLVPQVLEITNSHGEFGMSGGPIFSSVTNQFVGVLTHQYLQYIPGGVSEVGEYSARHEVKADHLFAISQVDVGKWLGKIFELSDTGAPSIVRDPFLQLANQEEAVFSSGLKFSLKNVSDLNSGVGGADGHGIGGADGHGIGGMDGHGIGGAGTAVSQTTVVEITLDMQNHLAKWDFLDRSPWMLGIKAQLLRNHRIQVPFFVEKSVSGLPKKQKINGLPQFFSLLKISQLRPVTLILDGISQDRTNRDQIVLAVQENGKALGKRVSEFKDQVALDQIIARQFLADLNILAEISATGDWMLLDEQWVKSLAKREDALKELINIRFDETVELIKLINDIDRDLVKLTLHSL